MDVMAWIALENIEPLSSFVPLQRFSCASSSRHGLPSTFAARSSCPALPSLMACPSCVIYTEATPCHLLFIQSPLTGSCGTPSCCCLRASRNSPSRHAKMGTEDKYIIQTHSFPGTRSRYAGPSARRIHHRLRSTVLEFRYATLFLLRLK